jgi:hypothetical protein
MGRSARLSLAVVIAIAAGVSSSGRANAAPTYIWRKAFPWPANFASAVVYDARRQRLFMFGSTKLPGLGGTYPAEHWEWNGASGTWAQLATSGTLPGNGVLMAYDSTRNLTVMLAPKEGFWERNGDGAGTWTLRGGPHPELTYAEAMVYDPDGARFLILARQTISQPPTLIWGWDTATGALTQLAQTGTPPTPARTYAAVAYDAGRRRLVVAGGYADPVPPDYAITYLMDTWEWNPATGAWAERPTTGSKPSGRAYARTAYHAGRGHVFLFGGYNPSFDPSGKTGAADLWEWDGAAGAWLAHPLPAGSPVPDGGTNYSLTYDGARGRLMIFGGSGNTDPTGVLWQNAMEWDDQAGAWIDRSPPVGREGPALAYDPARARVVMFGGYGNGVSYLNDLWEWDGAAHTWTRRSPAAPLPEPREYMSMVADEKHGTLVLAGGTGLGPLPGSWVLDGARTWTKYASSSDTPGGSYTTLVYDTGREVVLGLSGGAPGIVVEWDGASGTWTRRPLSTTPTPSRQASLFAFDAARGRLVAYGGYMSGVGGFLGDTWEWNPADATWTLRAPAGSTPSDRTYTGMYYDSARSRVVMLGGLASAAANTFVDTAWEWDGVAGAWIATPIAAAQPSNTRPRVGYWAGTAYDSGRGVAVTFGGKSLDYLKETYELEVTCPASPASCVAVAPPPDGGVGDGGGVDAADGGAPDATGAGGVGGATSGAGGARGGAGGTGGAAGVAGTGGASGRGGSSAGGRGGTTGAAGSTGGTSAVGGAAGSAGGTTGTAGGTTGAGGGGGTTGTGGIAGNAGGRGGAVGTAGAMMTAGTAGNTTSSAGCGCGVAMPHGGGATEMPLLVIVGAACAARRRRRR